MNSCVQAAQPSAQHFSLLSLAYLNVTVNLYVLAVHMYISLAELA